MQKSSLNIQEVTSLLLSQESRNERENQFSSSNLPSVNLETKVPSRGFSNDGKQSFNNGGATDYRFKGPNNSRNDGRNWANKQRTQCQICNKFGHTTVKCYFCISCKYLGPSNSGLSNASSNAVLAFTDLNKHINWCPDSRATNHLTHDIVSSQCFRFAY